MQVGIDVKCMYNNFGGRGFSGFGAIVTFLHGMNEGVYYVFLFSFIIVFLVAPLALSIIGTLLLVASSRNW